MFKIQTIATKDHTGFWLSPNTPNPRERKTPLLSPGGSR
jgi:hypothetical protein